MEDMTGRQGDPDPEVRWQSPQKRRRKTALYAGVTVAAVLVVGLAVGWYSSHSSLVQTRDQLDVQQHETQKYEQLSSQYATQLDEKSAELGRVNARLDAVETELEDMATRYENASSTLAATQAQLQKSSSDLEKSAAELQLYKDTWGSVVASGLKPPFQNVSLLERSSAVDPIWAQVESFVLADRTDQKTYVPDVYMCGEFASEVHNNAEQRGIRCALVAVRFSHGWHACNAFKTQDRGLVFIDCTGTTHSSGPSSCDKTVAVKLGNDYLPASMFPEAGWQTTWENMGTILDVQVYW